MKNKNETRKDIKSTKLTIFSDEESMIECDRCGKKVDAAYLIGISIADLKGKFYYCKACTCEFIDKWDAFHKGGKNGGTT